jgi:hypothetical protein
MPDRSLVSTFITGDPIRIAADISSAAELLSVLGLGSPAGVIDIASSVALVIAPSVWA